VEVMDVSTTIQLPLGPAVAALGRVGGGTDDEFDRLPRPEERAGAWQDPALSCLAAHLPRV
jgi:hypothetical protein